MIAIYTALTAPLIMVAVVINGMPGDHDNELLRYDPLVRHAPVPPPPVAQEATLTEAIQEPQEFPRPVITPVPTPTPAAQQEPPSPPTPRPANPQTLSVIPQTTECNWEAFARKISAVTQCESGGNYSTNTGNGYYGAWQFDLRTWQSVGGIGFPSDATAQEQDQRAFELYLARGWSPWPTCGLKG